MIKHKLPPINEQFRQIVMILNKREMRFQEKVVQEMTLNNERVLSLELTVRVWTHQRTFLVFINQLHVTHQRWRLD